MRKWFEQYFGFSRRELNGITALVVLLLLLWLGPALYRHWLVDELRNAPADIAEINRFLAASQEQQETSFAPPEYFPFDPNGLAAADWERLGLTNRQITMIKNYEAKGGRFWQPADLKKIYAITESDYDRLAPYIRIDNPSRIYEGKSSSEKPAADPESPRIVKKEAAKIIHPIELNATDSVELQVLPGIGPVFASRIVRFRDLLGGFYDVAQLLDVYGMDSIRYSGIKDHVFVDTAAVRKISINSAGYDQLRRHPLIGGKLANVIIQYRKQHGAYQQLSDLLEIAVLDVEIFRRIAPYLTIAHD